MTDEATLAVLAMPLRGRISRREAMLRYLLATSADDALGERVAGIDTPPGPETTRAVLAMPLPRRRVSRREAQLRVLLAVATLPADADGYRSTADDAEVRLVACLLPREFGRARDDLNASGLLQCIPVELPEAGS
jgi:hypothetical protein